MKILIKKRNRKRVSFQRSKNKLPCQDSNSCPLGKHALPSPLGQTAFGVIILKQNVFKRISFLGIRNTREDLHLLRLKFQTVSVGLGRRYSPCKIPKSSTSNINAIGN